LGKGDIAAIQLSLCLALTAILATAQHAAVSSTGKSSDPLQQGLDLAKQGRCDEASPLLKQLSADTSKETRYKVEMASARCALKRRDGQASVTALLALKHDFPQDPEVLYLSTQVFIQIAESASSELYRIAPHSYQVRRLQAESLESQAKWSEAAEIYRRILEENPNLPEIHFRLGHVALSQPDLPNSTEDAKREFKQELAIDPTNASAQFWLGEIAHRDGQWDEAISRFTSAAKLDADLWTAYLGLGMALNSADRFPEAIAPLEKYIAAMPDDATGHYQLAMSYRHVGRMQDAEREKALQQQLSEKQQARDAARAGVKSQ
jgi:tetratricopeptide (TPR) repeat protein